MKEIIEINIHPGVTFAILICALLVTALICDTIVKTMAPQKAEIVLSNKSCGEK